MRADYPYTQKNILQFPQTYMYPPYQGESFLVAWEKSRAACLNRLDIHRHFPEQPHDWNPTHTPDFLLYTSLTPDKLTTNDLNTLEGLLQRFEINKKLPRYLVPPSYSINGEALEDALPYACLAATLGYFSQNADIRQLNCLLKLNDLLCSLEELPVKSHPFVAMAFKAEKKAVERLREEL